MPTVSMMRSILVRSTQSCLKVLGGNPQIPTFPHPSFRSLYLNYNKPFDNYEEHRLLMKETTLPTYFNFARDVIDRWARSEQTGTKADVPAFWWVNDQGLEIKWNFTQISQLSKKFANVLISGCGLAQGDIIIVILPKVPEWWIINIGAIRAGVVLSSGTTQLRPKDIKHRLLFSKAKGVITDQSSQHNVQEVVDDCESVKFKMFVGEKSQTPVGWLNYEELMEKAKRNFETVKSKFSDPMTIFFTSGTTGPPKMTEHSHGSSGIGHMITARYMLDIHDGDIMWNLSDTGWAKCAWTCLFAPWLKGACVFIHNMPTFDPLLTVQVLEKYRPTHLCVPPTAMRRMVKAKLENFPYLGSMKKVICAGEPVNPELIEEWKEKTGGRIHEAYGQSETTFLCGTYECIPYKAGSMGKAAPGVDLQVVSDEGVPLPRGKEGNIAVRCLPKRPIGLFTRYVNDENKMAAVFQGEFYLTGDRGILDEEDYFWFVGRADDVILSSGYRIGPFEVENALLEHPAVLESAVVSSPDESRGEIVKAFVILTESFKSKDPSQLAFELQNHVKNITAPYKYPRKIEFVESLPKTVSGKIRRVELRNSEWGLHDAS